MVFKGERANEPSFFVSFLCRAEPFALRPLVVLLAFFAFDALAANAFLASRSYSSSPSPSTSATARVYDGTTHDPRPPVKGSVDGRLHVCSDPCRQLYAAAETGQSIVSMIAASTPGFTGPSVEKLARERSAGSQRPIEDGSEAYNGGIPQVTGAS